MDKLATQGGTGGIIGVDNKGNVTMTFNTSAMIRGFTSSKDSMQVKIFK
jgi:beta-aspartyl-peptidase (threonine type)